MLHFSQVCHQQHCPQVKLPVFSLVMGRCFRFLAPQWRHFAPIRRNLAWKRKSFYQCKGNVRVWDSQIVNFTNFGNIIDLWWHVRLEHFLEPLLDSLSLIRQNTIPIAQITEIKTIYVLYHVLKALTFFFFPQNCLFKKAVQVARKL